MMEPSPVTGRQLLGCEVDPGTDKNQKEKARGRQNNGLIQDPAGCS